ncbi:MAG: type II toxin-antitoxin system HicA family toxin [Faecalibacterium prausnitzii]|uniref:Type II toxin-antitoxin system HicA family toxin n=1 Tax=Faecalibacterium prausnitzii TaxID=853 RepID=A0A943FVL0_9FIRM|nr:type II toxin-antitoxin system HicA family toxin [Faecalibacterium prausnitzii]
MPMPPKEIVRLLEQNGFVFVSSNGSHRKYHNPTTGKTPQTGRSEEIRRHFYERCFLSRGVPPRRNGLFCHRPRHRGLLYAG